MGSQQCSPPSSGLDRAPQGHAPQFRRSDAPSRTARTAQAARPGAGGGQERIKIAHLVSTEEYSAMSTVKLVDETTKNPKVRAVFQDIKETKQIDRVPNIWRALATHPEHLELCWTRLKAIMRPGKLDLLTKEIIALAVST